MIDCDLSEMLEQEGILAARILPARLQGPAELLEVDLLVFDVLAQDPAQDLRGFLVRELDRAVERIDFAAVRRGIFEDAGDHTPWSSAAIGACLPVPNGTWSRPALIIGANGIVATGLNDLMRAAGLTHGGFYKHFESKDQLVAEACAEAVKTILEMLATAASEKGGLLRRTSRSITETIRPPDARCRRSAANWLEATRKPGRQRRLAS